MNATLRCLTLVALMCVSILSGVALAGMISPCSAPGMFPDTDVTVFVFPYVDYTSPESSYRESPVGTELAGLIQADTLLAISRFGNVAAIRLLGGPAQCKPEMVLDDLLNVFGQGRRDRAVILLWGRIFRVDEEIFVQSYASFRRFVHDDPGEIMQLSVGDRVLAAQLASQTIDFVPRHVSEGDLKQIRARFSEGSIVHERPEENSPGKPLLLLFPKDRQPAYYMTESKGDWIHIHTQTGQDGWILSHAMLGQQSLSARLPEMKFVEGVAGYFSLRKQPGGSGAELADAAFRIFEKDQPSPPGTAAVAISRQLRGMMVLLAQNQSRSAFDQAAPVFASAVSALPSNSAVLNMAAVVDFYRDFTRPGAHVDLRQTLNRFWSTISMNPDDKTALTNCWTILTIASNPQFGARFAFEPSQTGSALAQQARDMEDLQLKGVQVRLIHVAPVVAWPKTQ